VNRGPKGLDGRVGGQTEVNGAAVGGMGPSGVNAVQSGPQEARRERGVKQEGKGVEWRVS
jgi:hypothetical protein